MEKHPTLTDAFSHFESFIFLGRVMKRSNKAKIAGKKTKIRMVE